MSLSRNKFSSTRSCNSEKKWLSKANRKLRKKVKQALSNLDLEDYDKLPLLREVSDNYDSPKDDYWTFYEKSDPDYKTYLRK